MCLAGRGHSLLYRMGLGILMKTAFSYSHGGCPRLELARLGLQERPVLEEVILATSLTMTTNGLPYWQAQR